MTDERDRMVKAAPRRRRWTHWAQWATIGLMLATAAGFLIAGAGREAQICVMVAILNLLIWLFRRP
jgi:hypothetical protein